jgi:hypothetical protein
MTISPLFVNMDRRGGALHLQIMQQQFKQTIGGAIVVKKTKHWTGCLHYIPMSAEEAASLRENRCGSQVKMGMGMPDGTMQIP